MKTLHVVQSIDRSMGGPARSSQGLVAALESAGVESWLVSLVPGEKPWLPGVTHFFDSPDVSNAIYRIKPDLVHIHGVWCSGFHQAAAICRRWRIPYVIAPRGMLEPWSLKQHWLKKRIARFLYQDTDLKHAAALHATAESEAAQFRNLGFKNKVIISPNGVNVPSKQLKYELEGEEKSCRRALFVSRMHPKKGVIDLVDAWARVRPKGWQCELVYTLNGDAERIYEQQVKDRILSLGMSCQDNDSSIRAADSCDFIFTGPLDDDAKWQAYTRANLFILPTYSENFGIVIAEALYAGVPVITTKGTPWKELEKHQCGWWIDTGVNPLAKCLDDVSKFEVGELREMGERGKKLIQTKYTWSAAAGALIVGYKEILNEG